jgi:iron complex transport system substrate-binding protein
MMNPRLAMVGAATVVSVALLAGCGSSATSSTSSAVKNSSGGYPVTFTTANGKVTIPSRPHRIVSLSPTATEDLYAVGAGSQVVAVDADSNYPAGVPKTRLSGLTPNIEAIARYRPDLVVAYQNVGGLVSGLTKLGIPVLIQPATPNVAGVYSEIEQIGQATGHAAQAAQTVSSMRSQIAADVSQAGPGHKNLTYYWELSTNPYYSVTSQTFIGQIVSMFGLKNIADAASKASDGGYPELSQEYIVAARPQIIFLADNQPSDGGQTPAIVSGRAGWNVIPAVKNHEVIAMNDDIASRWGPRLPQLVAEIAQAVERAAG